MPGECRETLAELERIPTFAPDVVSLPTCLFSSVGQST